eukprot:767783-Hanusia_phi.AAC.2
MRQGGGTSTGLRGGRERVERRRRLKTSEEEQSRQASGKKEEEECRQISRHLKMPRVGSCTRGSKSRRVSSWARGDRSEELLQSTNETRQSRCIPDLLFPSLPPALRVVVLRSFTVPLIPDGLPRVPWRKAEARQVSRPEAAASHLTGMTTHMLPCCPDSISSEISSA